MFSSWFFFLLSPPSRWGLFVVNDAEYYVVNFGGDDHYYPLGGPIAQYSSVTSQQPLKFQGKEWGASKGLDLYDFGARRYDPASGRWLAQDPLAEKYYAHSPYLFCAANPMKFVDPSGLIWYSVNANGYITVIDSEKDGPDRLYSNYPSGDIGPFDANDYIEVQDPRLLKALSEGSEMSQVWSDSEELGTIFSFVSSRTNVEWLIRSFKRENGGMVYNLVTKHKSGSVAGSFVDKRFYGVSEQDLYAQIHSHPGIDYTPPSGNFLETQLSEKSDAVNIRDAFMKIYGQKASYYEKARPYFYMYHPASNSLTRYTMYNMSLYRKTNNYQSIIEWLK